MPGGVALPGPYPYGPLLSVHLWHLNIKFVIIWYTINPSLNLTKFPPSLGFSLSAPVFTLPCQEWLLCLGHTLMAPCLVPTYGTCTLEVFTQSILVKPDYFSPSRGFFIVSSNVYPAMPGVVALPGPYPYGPLLSVHLWLLCIKSLYSCYTINPGLNLTNFPPLRGFHCQM